MARLDGVAAEGFPAIYLDQVTVDVAGLVGGEEHREVGDVLDLAPALERDGLGKGLVEVPVVEQLPRQGRLGVGRADSVDPDLVLAVLDRQATGEVGLGTLGDVVGGLVGGGPAARQWTPG